MKKLLSVTLMVLISFSLFAGGSQEQQTGKDETLRVQWWGSQTRHDQTLQVIELFEEQNPGITVEPEFLGWSGYWEKIATQAAGGDMADVIQMALAQGWGLQYVEKNLLTDMNEYVGKGILNIDKVSSILLEPVTIDNSLYGIPLGTTAATLLINEDVFSSAGVSVPDEDWTWDDFADAARTIHKQTGAYGVGEFVSYDIFPIYLRENGATLFSADGSGLGYTDDNLFTEFFSLKLALQSEGVMPTPDAVNQLTGMEDKFIVHDKAGIGFCFSNQGPAISNAAGKVLKNVLIPGPDIDKGMSMRISMEFTIPSQGKNQETAARFVNYFINDIQVNEIMKGERGVPVSSDIRNALISVLPEAQIEMFEFINLVSRNCSPADSLPPSSSAEVIQALKDVEEEILYGVITPAEGAVKFRTLSEDILSR